MLSTTLRGGNTRLMIDELKHACETSRCKYIENRWRPALRRLPGFLESDVDVQTDIDVEKPKQQTVTTINFCYRNYLAFLAQAIPRIRNLQAVAASREVKDLRAAFAVERAVRSEMFGHRGAFTDALLRMVSFVFNCHTGYVIVEGVVKKGEKYGEVRMKAYSPLDVYWFPGTRRMEDSPYVVLVEQMTREDIEDRWGDVPKGVDGARWPEKSGMEQIQPGLNESMYEVNRVFIKPCRAYPKGASRVVLTGAKKDLWKSKDGGSETIGTPDGAYPIVGVADIPCGYLDFGESRMNLMQGPQRIANIAYSRFVQTVTENPEISVWTPLGSGVNPDTWGNGTTSFQNYNPVPGNKPQVIPTPTPTMSRELLGDMEGLINNVSSSSPVSRGQSEGSRMPVGTTRTLVEKAADQDAPLIERLKEGVSVIAERIIIEGRNVWKPNRIFLVVGTHRKYEAVEFTKANLKDHFSVRVRPDDGMPKNDADRWDYVTKGAQAGIWGPVDDPKTGAKIRRALEISTEEEEFSWGHKDDQAAYDDFLRMKDGEEPQVSLCDDHRVHYSSEKRYGVEEKNATGEPLGEDMEERMWGHWNAHALAQQRNNQIEQAMGQLPPPPPGQQPPGGQQGGQPGAQGPGGPAPEELPPEGGMEQLPPQEGLPPEAGMEQMM
jgi:hypothetical protein